MITTEIKTIKIQHPTEGELTKQVKIVYEDGVEVNREHYSGEENIVIKLVRGLSPDELAELKELLK